MEAACSDNSVSEDIGSESNLPSLNSKESNTEDQQNACSNMEDTVEIEIQEECNYCSENKEDEVPVNGVHLQDSHTQLSEVAATSDEDDLANSMEISTSMESGLSVSFDGSVEKCLSKSATFPSSELEFSHPCEEEIPASPTHKPSVSAAAPSDLVSAMKGGRAQSGIALRSDLHVKWAPDVYDPPTTSSRRPQSTKQSSNHPRIKPKRKDKHKEKHPKGKKKHAKGHT
ncbi:hypothetical protein KFK09_001015 [Dendrobium nobile]|uniref:Uncharacterized protein n=1 Tax=Dendrobium nobile TaxID=94219 RepID=A0A8T3CGK9_DENNO|nr:hypothetical protein KFK09_001015 [Dendrobium nobile]